MPALNLTLFGGFEARSGSRAISLPRKAQALLAYLALAPAPTHSRAKLAALLWGDVDEDGARNSLRQVLFRTRRALGRAASVLTVGPDSVGLDPRGVESDAVTFRRLLAEGGEAALRAAADLYRGKLLDGFELVEPAFEEWLGDERAELHEQAVGALRTLMVRTAAPARAAQTALRLLALDPFQEEAHRTLMQAYADAGRRAAALRQYGVCVEILQRELQTEPEPETRALYRALLLRARTSPPRIAPSAAPPERARMSGPPLTGRDAALAALTAELQRALAGTARVVAVLGEAGAGKTRLVEEAMARAVEHGYLALEARAYETEQGLPFALWVTALRSAGVLGDPAFVDGLGPEWRDALNPLFPELPGRRRRASVESENQRRLFEALTRVVHVLAAAHPVALILEDLQWADQTSLRLLAFLIRRLPASRVCALFTARSEDIEPRGGLATLLSELRETPQYSEVLLDPLTRPDAERLIEALAPRAPRRLSPVAVERIWQMSEGNPFVIMEAVRSAREGRWPDEGAGLALPERVRRLCLDRLERLSTAARDLAATAALVGRAFDYALARQAAAMPDGQAAEAVEELVRRGVLRPLGDGFDFAHDRLREAVVGTLVAPRRRQLHLQVAAAIEEIHAANLDDHQAALAGHYREAEQWLPAVDCLRQASMLAAARGAFREAADLLEQALALLDRMPPERPARERAVDVRIELWDRVVVLPDFRRGEECLLEAMAVAGDLGDERRRALAAASLANHDVQVRNLDRGRRLGEESLAIAERVGDDLTGARAANALGVIRYLTADLEGAVEAFARGIKAAGDDQLTTFSVGLGLCHVHLRGWQALLLAELGRFEDALRLAREALDRAEAVHNIFSLAFAHLMLARVLLLRGDLATALRHLETGFALVERYDIGLVRRMYVAWSAYASAMAGLADEAFDMASQGPPLWPTTHLARGRALLAKGRCEEASEAAREGLALARRVGERTQEVAALLLLGDIHAGQGAPPAAGAAGSPSPATARSHYEEAVALASALGLRAYEAHGRRGLGAALVESDEAREHLAAALALYRELGMESWSAHTAGLIARMEG